MNTFFTESRRHALIAGLTLIALAVHLVLWLLLDRDAESRWDWHDVPLLLSLFIGGLPLVWELLTRAWRLEFGADWLAGISIVTSVLLGEYLAGTIVVLMLSGGSALEAYAVRSASSVLANLAKRMPSVAHQKRDSHLAEIALDQVVIGDILVIFPHEIAPVDGTVVEGHGVMDESYLTGEPYVMSKTPGSLVMSGAINGDSALTIRADKVAADSRYAKIMQVMRASEQQRPQMRRLGDRLGAWYTPVAVGIALAAWLLSGEPTRFLGVLVVATPCPLLIAIPVAILGAISLSARRGIIIKDPAILETIDTCNIAIFDKTGTLTIGEPKLTETLPSAGIVGDEVLRLTASLEQYSKHPLAEAVRSAAQERQLLLANASEISEPQGQGLQGKVAGRSIRVTNRKKLLAEQPALESMLPTSAGGLECVVLIDGQYAATLRFRDQPRRDGRPFILHLRPKHQFDRVMLMSGDRESEVKYLAEAVGIDEVYASQTPEQKWTMVKTLSEHGRTLFVGDGINDAPALAAATVGVAFGQNSDITTEAAGAVVLDTSLMKVDELFHISRRLRQVVLQSVLGGMALSILGMGLAAFGWLPPVGGAIFQEVIDVFAIVNALRVALPPASLSDY
jgi:heavy metal translocating P-type ATPase